MAVSAGPNAAKISTSTTTAVLAPVVAERQSRPAPAAGTIVSASTASTRPPGTRQKTAQRCPYRHLASTACRASSQPVTEGRDRVPGAPCGVRSATGRHTVVRGVQSPGMSGARSPGAVVPTAPGDHIPPWDPQTCRRLLSVAHNHGETYQRVCLRRHSKALFRCGPGDRRRVASKRHVQHRSSRIRSRRH